MLLLLNKGTGLKTAAKKGYKQVKAGRNWGLAQRNIAFLGI